MTGESWPRALARLTGRNRRRYGGFLVHAGIAVLFLGVAGSSAFIEQRDVRLSPGERFAVGDYKIEYQPTGQASCGFLGSAGSAEIIAGPALNDGRWHTVQCVKTATSIRLVVDGQTFSKRARIGSISNHAPLVIGSRPGSEFFVGSLDEAYVQVG